MFAGSMCAERVIRRLSLAGIRKPSRLGVRCAEFSLRRQAPGAGLWCRYPASGRLIWPPPTGVATPVVPGADVDKPRATRTAR